MKKIEEIVDSLVEDEMALLSKDELLNIYEITSATKGGDIVEVGTFKGASALMMCHAKKQRKLHLFDTWNGIEEISDEDHMGRPTFFIGRYFAELEPVKKLLSKFKNVHFYQGIFPETYTDNIDKVSMIHLDVDLYRPTKTALEIFWDKLVPGGAIIVHDYPSFYGVQIAVDNFIKDKNVVKTQLEKSQLLIEKI